VTGTTLLEERPIFSHSWYYILTLSTPLGLTDKCKKMIVTGTSDSLRQAIVDQVSLLSNFFPSSQTRLNKLVRLSYEGKAEAVPIGAPFRCFFMGKLLLLPWNVKLDCKVIACYKHCSSVCLIDCDEGKRFYNIDTRIAVTSSSIPWTKWSTMLWMRPSKSHSWLLSSRRSCICPLMHRKVLKAPGSSEGSAKKWRVSLLKLKWSNTLATDGIETWDFTLWYPYVTFKTTTRT